MKSPPTRFSTIHSPGRHEAKHGDKVIVPACPTEIDLARKLSDLGVDLTHYSYSSKGSADSSIVEWWYDRDLPMDHLGEK